MRSLPTRRLSVTVALTALAGLAAGLAWAAIPDGNVVNTCFDTSSGALRAVPVSTDCVAGESAVALGGPTRGYATSRPGDVTLGPTATELATLVLPEGAYLVSGKVNVANLNFTALGSTFVPCSLQADGTGALDQSWIQLMSAFTGVGANAASVSLQSPLTVTTKTVVRLTCASIPRPGGPTTNVRARFRQLAAVQVDALQIQ